MTGRDVRTGRVHYLRCSPCWPYVLDAVTVRKPIASREAGVSGVGNLIGTAMAQRGRSSPYVPELQAQGRSTEGVDAAVRAAIEEAVIQLARRFGQ